MKKLITLLALAGIISIAMAQDNIATLRDYTLNDEPVPPAFGKVENKDIRRTRAYPMQPPTIPHDIRDYRIDLNSNKCLFCHSRNKAEEMGAPMVSVTHYMDREGQFLSQVSPRRYFCVQCHVPLEDVPTLVDNEFVDADHVIKQQKK